MVKRISPDGGFAFGDHPVALRVARRIQQVIIALWIACAVGAGSLVAGAIVTDHKIDAHPGQAVATITGVSYNRTTASFIDDQGRSQSPPGGLLYPKGVGEGQKVRIEYDTSQPWRAKVAGRSWVQTLPVAGVSMLVVTGVCAIALALVSARKKKLLPAVS